MRLRFGPNPQNPIAIDLGWSCTKLLQLGEGQVQAADEIPVPRDVGEDLSGRLDSLAEALPSVLSDGAFRGRRVVLAMPAFQTVLQAMQLEACADQDETLAMQMRLPTQQAHWMIRSIDVSSSSGSGRDVICQAISRQAVLKHVELLHGMKLEIVGIVAQPHPIVAAFHHINQRSKDADHCTVYVDIGAGGSTAVMAHGQRIVLARSIATGGRHLDACIAQELQCSSDAAQQLRLMPPVDGDTLSASSMSSKRPTSASAADSDLMETVVATDRRSSSGTPSLGPNLDGVPAVLAQVDLSAVIEALVDDLQLCLRHHRATWPHVQVSRVIFTGGEARQSWLCRRIVQALHLPGQVGDPLARLKCSPDATGLVGWPDRVRPDWSVAAGLSALHDHGGLHAAE